MIQVIEMTHEEKIDMYMKMSKKELSEMLVNANNLLHCNTPQWTFVEEESIFSYPEDPTCLNCGMYVYNSGVIGRPLCNCNSTGLFSQSFTTQAEH